MKSVALNGCWKMLLRKAVNGIQGFLSQQNAAGNIHLLVHKVAREGFSHLEKTHMQEVPDSHADDLTEGDIEQLTTSAWKKELQVENNLVSHSVEIDSFLDS